MWATKGSQLPPHRWEEDAREMGRGEEDNHDVDSGYKVLCTKGHS